jgi:deoxyadenosine/deoxycytidine kinase
LEGLRYIVVEGVSGVGKSHVVKALAKRLDGKQVNDGAALNPFLQHSYRDRRSYAFVTQVFFLLYRFRQQ